MSFRGLCGAHSCFCRSQKFSLAPQKYFQRSSHACLLWQKYTGVIKVSQDSCFFCIFQLSLFAKETSRFF